MSENNRRTPWSETPWYVHKSIEVENRFNVSNTEKDEYGSSITGSGCVFQTYEDATRIADCVNACAGMDDPQAEITRLNSQVEKMREALETCTYSQDSGRCGTAQHYCFDEALVREALEGV